MKNDVLDDVDVTGKNARPEIISSKKSISVRAFELIKAKPRTYAELKSIIGPSARQSALPRLIAGGYIVSVPVANQFNSEERHARFVTNEYRWTGKEYRPSDGSANLRKARDKVRENRIANRAGLMSTLEISGLLGLMVSPIFLESCGIAPVRTELVGTRVGVLWRADDLPEICIAIERHLQSIAKRYRENRNAEA